MVSKISRHTWNLPRYQDDHSVDWTKYIGFRPHQLTVSPNHATSILFALFTSYLGVGLLAPGSQRWEQTPPIISLGLRS